MTDTQAELRAQVRFIVDGLVGSMINATNQGPFEGDRDEWVNDTTSDLLALLKGMFDEWPDGSKKRTIGQTIDDMIDAAKVVLKEQGLQLHAGASANDDMHLALTSIYKACKRRAQRKGLSEERHLDFAEHTAERAKKGLVQAGLWPLPDAPTPPSEGE